jgi:hypothetical protein
MAIPVAITSMGRAAQRVSMLTLTFANPSAGGRMISKTFYAYLEVGMQSKHDVLMRGYCDLVHVVKRDTDGNQVPHPRGTTAAGALGPGGLYDVKGRKAADVVLTQMKEKWAKPQVAGTSVFTANTRVDASVQKVIQSDNYRYEVSYWYQDDGVYVLFHCYPA